MSTEPLPEHHQPSSDARILKWVGALTALAVGAALVRRSRLADD